MLGVNTISIQDQSIIQKRLGASSSLATPTQFNQSEGDVTIETKLDIDNADLEFLLTHQGNFRVASEGGLPWFKQKDILETAVSFDDKQRTVLRVSLTGEAARRVARLSASTEETVILVTLDDEILSTARVTSPIPNGVLQMTIDKTPHEAMLITKLIESGPLSFQAKVLQIK